MVGSGIIVFLFPNLFSREKSSGQLALSSLLFSITVMVTITVYVNSNFTPTSSLASFISLAKIFIFIFLPYFFSGLAITLALKHYSDTITVLYCFDLLAGLGCLVSIGMLFVYDGLSIVIFISFLGACACFIFSRLTCRHNGEKGGGFGLWYSCLPHLSVMHTFLNF